MDAKPLVTVAALAAASFMLSGCWDGSTEMDPDTVSSRIEHMEVHRAESPTKDVVIPDAPEGVAWAMVPESEVRYVAAAKCTLDGEPMGRPDMDFLAHGDSVVKAAGGDDIKGDVALFAVGVIAKPGTVTVSCDLPDVSALFVAVDDLSDEDESAAR